MSDAEFDNIPIDILSENMPPEVAAVIFATIYDASIQTLLDSMRHLGFSEAEFSTLLSECKSLMDATIPVPSGMTLKESQPYVWISDLITLGALAHVFFDQRDRFFGALMMRMSDD